MGLKLLVGLKLQSLSPTEATSCGVGRSLAKDEDPTPFHVASLGLKLWG